ncbi:hypothetical protein GX645_05190 [Candidatus Sumerlaeota bacterium]|nr:hypothetical protein [Candidatus Sumerlaeota bacterium]
MSTRTELQSQIAVLNKEITEVIDANRLSAGSKPVTFPVYSWMWTLLITILLILVMVWPSFSSYIQTKFFSNDWLTSGAFEKTVTYLPLFGLLLGWYATFWTMRWVFYRTVTVRSVKAGHDAIYSLEAQRRELLDELRRLGDADDF